eukprot:1182618-Prorocentrum_minimum.AAC.1
MTVDLAARTNPAVTSSPAIQCRCKRPALFEDSQPSWAKRAHRRQTDRQTDRQTGRQTFRWFWIPTAFFSQTKAIIPGQRCLCPFVHCADRTRIAVLQLFCLIVL